MRSAAFHTIMSLLPKLSHDELAEVRKALNALGAIGGGSREPGSGARVADDVSWVLSSILGHFPELSTPVAVLRNSSQFKPFNEKLPAVLHWLRGVSPRRVQQQALLRVALGLLKHDIARSTKVTVTPGVMMTQIGTLPATLDRHFPGYADAGLLPLILRKEEG